MFTYSYAVFQKNYFFRDKIVISAKYSCRCKIQRCLDCEINGIIVIDTMGKQMSLVFAKEHRKCIGIAKDGTYCMKYSSDGDLCRLHKSQNIELIKIK